MSELRDQLGQAAVLSLSETAGGRILRVPANHSPSNSLSRLVGADLAAKLVEAFPRSRVYVPRGPSAHNGPGKMIDRDVVAQMTKDRRTAEAIATHLNCTTRTIHKIRGRQRSPHIVK